VFVSVCVEVEGGCECGGVCVGRCVCEREIKIKCTCVLVYVSEYVCAALILSSLNLTSFISFKPI
jgi:hypothetical protein